MSVNVHIGFSGFALLFGIAGLMLPIGAALVALAVSCRRTGEGQAKAICALLALGLMILLGFYLVLDAVWSVSVSFPFVAVYAALWVVMGAVLLADMPWRHKLVIVGLYVAMFLFVWPARTTAG
jgi:hypothetical protein